MSDRAASPAEGRRRGVQAGRRPEGRAAADRMVAGVQARAIALDLLSAVLIHRRPLDATLEQHAALPDLPQRDRAFVRNLTATTLRRLGQIDNLLEGLLKRPLAATDRVVGNVLRLGATQLVFLHTPPHAAVDTAVRLVRRHRPHASGLVNAVLRRVAAVGVECVGEQDVPRLNTPDWLWQRWQAVYGAAVCRAIANAHLREPPLDLTVRHPDDLLLSTLQAKRLPTGSLRLAAAAGLVSDLRGFREGEWWVQDAAAALPVQLFGKVANRHVIDLCGAPGGKTAQLAAAGATVTVVERDAARMRLVEATLSRLRLAASLVVADAITWRPTTPVEAVLLDAPCMATGTIRRHPDVAWLKQPADLDRLVAMQRALLDAAVAMLRPGGILVYATCSLEPEEGAMQIARLLAEGAPLAPLPIEAEEVGGLAEVIGKDGWLRTLPHHLSAEGGLDGFFAARLRRV